MLKKKTTWRKLLSLICVATLVLTVVLSTAFTGNKPVVAAGETVYDETVIFEFEDENYTVVADENGLAKLPIDRDVGEYNITTTYNNISIVNYIIILIL